MPYTLATIPEAVKQNHPSAKDQRRWIAVFNSAYGKAKKDGKSDKDAEQAAFAQANGVVKGGESDVAAEPNADYLGKLRDLIKSKIKDGDLSDADIKAIIRAAAGYSGGMAKARNRMTVESFTAAEGDSLWVGFWLPSDVANEIALPGGELPGELHLTLAMLGKTTDLPEGAPERLRIAVQAFCQTVEPFDLYLNGISRFDAEDGSDGKDVIYATVDCEPLMDFRWRLCMALCDAGLVPKSDHAFTPHVTLTYVEPGRQVTAPLPNIEFPLDSLTIATGPNASDRETFMLSGKPNIGMPLVMSERQYMEPPATMPVLPKPGTYTHPVYGKIDMSPDRIASFVQNFKDQVYQDRLPIDLEHETKLSGAAGWITDLITNADGSVDAVVEWTQRGTDALKADSFLYSSPEWYDEWRDPIDGAIHKDILIGAALTTRPFFKPAAMRSLAASEDPPHTREKEIPMPDDPKVTPVTLSEEQIKRFADIEAKNTQLEAELSASKAANEQSAAQATQLAERVATMEKDTRRKRFTAEVTGKSESGGPRWFGEPDKHVAVLETLADTVGEESDVFTGFITQQRALAEQMKTSMLFKEAGTSGAETSEDPQQQIVALAQKRATEKGIGIGEAQRQVVNEHPELARRAAKAAEVRV